MERLRVLLQVADLHGFVVVQHHEYSSQVINNLLSDLLLKNLTEHLHKAVTQLLVRQQFESTCTKMLAPKNLRLAEVRA